jgi:hypothetical protein
MRERGGRIRTHLGDDAIAELPSAPHHPERLALDQLGDQEGTLAVGGQLVEGGDVAMGEAGDRLGLARDSGGSVVAVDHLDRDRSLQPLVPGPVDGAEATAPNALLDQESPQDRLTDHRLSKFGVEALFPLLLVVDRPGISRSTAMFILRPVWHSSMRNKMSSSSPTSRSVPGAGSGGRSGDDSSSSSGG